jgi:Na+-translocating ferredoxin:NAD+ oxidoreductase subunit E
VTRGMLRPFVEGITKNMPPFLLVLGICPTLAVTTSIRNGLAMGAAVIGVLVCSNLIISAVRKSIPSEVRIPCYIVIIAAFVTMVELIIKALSPAINAALGIFVPLIVVNCIILGRAEAFAARNGILASVMDGLGVGFGFMISLILMGGVRELLGSGSLLGIRVSESFEPVSIMVQAPGAFLLMGLILGLFRWVGLWRRRRLSKEMV